MLNILVICTGNSCRSVMGEALFRHLGQGRVNAFSAGSQPLFSLNPQALATLKRHGLPIKHYKSESWENFKSHKMDIVITVCDRAAAETCPLYLRQAVRVNWGVADPSRVKGTQKQIVATFDKTFELLQYRVHKMLTLPLETLSFEQLTVQLNAIAQADSNP